ncbi:MAG: peptidase [Gammaproteobacteria bacterium]|jgi:putative proteasome-type protease|nr:peptidase [Gammaproteobacteria bacterium]
MTYCLAIKLDDGLVFCSDSRTNAGVDRVSTYSKMHTWENPGKCVFVLMSAGNLATTQGVVTHINRDIDEHAEHTLYTVRYLTEAAEYIGKLSMAEQARHSESVESGGFKPEATFILGGQISGQPQDLYLVYPQGNHIRVSDLVPFLQVGETKYGKPILDRIIRTDTSLEDAVRCALVSMDSTMRSNVTVGPPIELAVYKRDDLRLDCHTQMAADHDYLVNLKQSWDARILQAFADLPAFDATRFNCSLHDG